MRARWAVLIASLLLLAWVVLHGSGAQPLKQSPPTTKRGVHP